MAAAEQNEATARSSHPTIAKRFMFDGNSFDIPVGTPTDILNDDEALRRAYAQALGRPELTQAQIEKSVTEVDGHLLPVITLRARPQIKGAATDALPVLFEYLRRIPSSKGLGGTTSEHAIRSLLESGLTVNEAIQLGISGSCDQLMNPDASGTSRNKQVCMRLDTLAAEPITNDDWLG